MNSSLTFQPQSKQNRRKISFKVVNPEEAATVNCGLQLYATDMKENTGD